MFYFSNIIYNQKKESMFKMFEYNPNLLGLINHFQKITKGEKYENYNGKLNYLSQVLWSWTTCLKCSEVELLVSSALKLNYLS